MKTKEDKAIDQAVSALMDMRIAPAQRAIPFPTQKDPEKKFRMGFDESGKPKVHEVK